MNNKNIQLPLFEDKTVLPTKKFHVSYSELADWYECSYRHKLKHINKIQLDGASVHTVFGSVLHDALERYVKTKTMPPSEEIIEKLKEGVQELLFTESSVTAEEAQEFINVVEPIISQVPQWLDEEFPDWKLISAEEYLFEPIENQTNKHFKGYIDLVIKVPKRKKGKITSLSGIKGEVVKGEWVYWLIDWKGQRLTAPILTPNGWTTMGELKIGQSITSSDGSACKVTGIFPLGKRDVYRVHFRDGSFTDVTDDHLWKVYRSDNRSKVLSTMELLKEKKYVFIPTLSSPAIFSSRHDYSIKPYNFGLMLGKEKLEENHIPKEYLFGSPKQRLALLQGLFDANGWTQKGIAKYSTISEQLAKDTKHLVCSLGGVAFVSQRHNPKKGPDYHEYVVTARLPKSMKPFRLTHKLVKWNNNNYQKNNRRRIIKIEKVGEDQMQCISVSAPDQLYVTDDFIVTHNTTNWGWRTEQKRSFQKHMQLILYKHFWCLKHNVSIKDVKCGFGFLKRRARKDGSRIDMLTVSVGPKAIEKAMAILHNFLNQMQAGMHVKNKMSCRFCRYAGTKWCP